MKTWSPLLCSAAEGLSFLSFSSFKSNSNHFVLASPGLAGFSPARLPRGYVYNVTERKGGFGPELGAKLGALVAVRACAVQEGVIRDGEATNDEVFGGFWGAP